MNDGTVKTPDVWRVTWQRIDEDRSFSRDCSTLDGAITIAARHWPAEISALETQPDGSLMLLAIFRVNWERRH